jgi:hypothetical protein
MSPPQISGMSPPIVEPMKIPIQMYDPMLHVYHGKISIAASDPHVWVHPDEERRGSEGITGPGKRSLPSQGALLPVVSPAPPAL